MRQVIGPRALLQVFKVSRIARAFVLAMTIAKVVFMSMRLEEKGLRLGLRSWIWRRHDHILLQFVLGH